MRARARQRRRRAAPAWPPCARSAGLRLLRPLLAVPKARLVATLRAAGEPWIVDPSNADAPLRAAPACGRTRPSTRRGAVGRRRSPRAGRAKPTTVRLAALLARHRPARTRWASSASTRAAWSRSGAPGRAALLRRAAHHRRRPPPIRRRRDAGRLARRSPADGRTLAAASSCARRERSAGLPRARPDRRPADPRRPARRRVWDGRFAVGFRDAAVARSRSAPWARTARRCCRRRSRRAARRRRARRRAARAAVGLGRRRELVACPPLGALRSAAGGVAFRSQRGCARRWPLAARAFAGVNVVSNPQPPIYRRCSRREPAADGAGRPASRRDARANSRRTQ